ncbi:MAG: nucleotidyltransferase domain-containing protein [Bacteroidota bacterium]|nr:nucleotidyltransferase domain-containing protein [Bacteroidota bacterium]MDP4196279.1 nucleotidyltransferase domain-containing protein [Bacteroidota bacterium]
MNNTLSQKDLQNATELKNQLLSKYGSLIEQIYCYGSRVYAQKEEDTDFDILIITHRKIDWKEERVIYKDIFSFGLDRDIQFDVKFFSSEEVNHTLRQMPFLKNVLSYGIAV